MTFFTAEALTPNSWGTGWMGGWVAGMQGGSPLFAAPQWVVLRILLPHRNLQPRRQIGVAACSVECICGGSDRALVVVSRRRCGRPGRVYAGCPTLEWSSKIRSGGGGGGGRLAGRGLRRGRRGRGESQAGAVRGGRRVVRVQKVGLPQLVVRM